MLIDKVCWMSETVVELQRPLERERSSTGGVPQPHCPPLCLDVSLRAAVVLLHHDRLHCLEESLCLADEERAWDGERGSREGMLCVLSDRPICNEKLITVMWIYMSTLYVVNIDPVLIYTIIYSFE